MKISDVIKCEPRKSLVTIFCTACHKPVVDQSVHIEVQKTVVVNVGKAEGDRPVPVTVILDVCANCYGEFLYTGQQIHREVTR